MRKVWLALLATATLAACNTMPVAQEEFDYICNRIAAADCSGVKAPFVVTTNLVNGYRAYGVHIPGERAVYLATGLSELRAREVRFHETVHYVVFKTGLKRSRCESEAMARFLTDEYFARPYDDSWKSAYNCS